MKTSGTSLIARYKTSKDALIYPNKLALSPIRSSSVAPPTRTQLNFPKPTNMDSFSTLATSFARSDDEVTATSPLPVEEETNSSASNSYCVIA
ncbi:hypothetical protein C8R41DRAFT_610445 [Lentinula lateritia]|uniref:Pheromone n=1 Tax=Lentinula lateritia TaxID=40482 RepID=A0ABQ8VTX7_9AGAR|nr:hypothetical protein C8R41DRAFT_610445 [Lentinula lateritia]